LLLGLADPEIPVKIGRLKLAGKISNYEDEHYAWVGVTLYHYGPPLASYTFHRPFPWADVHYAWESGHPLLWY
jgi:hypothetical protein